MKQKHQMEKIHDALNFLEDDFIEEVDRLRRTEKKVKKTTGWRRWAVLAACICMFVVVSQIWKDNLDRELANDQVQQENQNTPVEEGDLDESFNGDNPEIAGPSDDENDGSDTEDVTNTEDESTEDVTSTDDNAGDAENEGEDIAIDESWGNSGIAAVYCVTEEQSILLDEEIFEHIMKLIEVFKAGPFMAVEDSLLQKEKIEDSDILYCLEVVFADGDSKVFLLLDEQYATLKGHEDVCVKVEKEIYKILMNRLGE